MDGRDFDSDEARKRPGGLSWIGKLVNSGAAGPVVVWISFSCKDKGTLVSATTKLLASIAAGGSISASRIRRLPRVRNFFKKDVNSNLDAHREKTGLNGRKQRYIFLLVQNGWIVVCEGLQPLLDFFAQFVAKFVNSGRIARSIVNENTVVPF